MLVEFPLVLVLALGLTVAAIQPAMRNIVGLIGGLSLICFGIMQIYEVDRKIPNQNRKLSKIPRSSVLLGLILTGLNPYFLIWWFTVGSVLILQALAYSMMLGVLLMYVSHVWMDFAFLTALAHFGKRANAFLGSGYYRIVMLGFSLVLVYYGITFLILALGTVQ
jgi:threonine/homoserine/homoserine lactone efflux protein